MPATSLQRLQTASTQGHGAILTALVAALRVRGGDDEAVDAAFAQRFAQLQTALQDDPATLQAIRASLQQWLTGLRIVAPLTQAGILPRSGFVQEAARRVYDAVNPPPREPDDVAVLLRQAFSARRDLKWITALRPERWLALFAWLQPDRHALAEAWLPQLLDVMEKLAVWVAAEEMEGDLARLDPQIFERLSPFSALQREVAEFVRDYRDYHAGQRDQYHDGAHLRVLLDQSLTAVERYRKRSLKLGATIRLTYLLERLEQTLQRIGAILDIVGLSPRSPDAKGLAVVKLWRSAVLGTLEADSVRALWRQTNGLLARKVSNNASEHGEHYVTSDRRGYLRMLLSSAGAGLVIPLMAIGKLKITAMGLPLLLETLLYCLDYGLGFVLIHILGFTVATKQPAMTAAHLSSAIEREGRAEANPRTVVELATRVIRTQLVSIVGNVTVALAVAMLIASLYLHGQGQLLVSPRESAYLLGSLHPFAGLALLHAAIAGVWLFVSGLVAGYFDNRYELLRLGDRLQQHPLWRRVLPQRLRRWLAGYLDEHYGALWGNFLFGVMLAGTGMFGVLTGLPIDIRHVAFSAANLGLASGVHPADFFVYLLFVLLVGAVNLGMSFTLALTVALRARGLRIRNGRVILRALIGKLKVAPLDFVLPPAARRSAPD